MNAAEALRVCCRNHLQRLGTCTPQDLRDTFKKLEHTSCTYVKGPEIAYEDVFTYMHHIASSGHMQPARSRSCVQ